MSHVLYREDNSYILQHCKTEASAKAARTRMFKKSTPSFNVAIAEEKHYRDNIEQFVERTNIMTGKKFTESINTPISCSPAFETYFAM